MTKQKNITSLAVIFSSIVLVVMLWQIPAMLILGLSLTALIKHKYSPIKNELLMFITSAIIGSIGESLIMLGGPWSYNSTQLFNFPIWLPFLWGLAGITGITIYESVSEK